MLSIHIIYTLQPFRLVPTRCTATVQVTRDHAVAHFRFEETGLGVSASAESDQGAGDKRGRDHSGDELGSGYPGGEEGSRALLPTSFENLGHFQTL
jgi:hypothetical protein